ncbi:bifunctional folylpolyglutamate synthase/dihydrofolate synthase [Caproicibacterium lactatifermentans]|jgi:dihydrofolate synthase/folylpolyglutamate synthase|uniref:tetrahydrofolate synthase n=1 Tax=Caproicibacterium lactatifermentans TaxID=2666138 RepID=A0ABX6PTP8_9FIRM|nr:folylpolyglutamate synthase/dihydrofolate synthase family protein [Caproicibacterium lactatifermentans]QKO29596.1 bifunctional folylpolyglutamate synthase/dihydrofolate synthase [Caproicibacterium lactatifermentans]
MTYEEVLQQIHALHRFKKVPGLAHLRTLLHTLGDPQDYLRFVHVAGTNGKGSTSTMIAAMLQHSGFRTGLFTSPFVVDFRERFQLNGRMIPRKELVRTAQAVLPPLMEMEHRGEDLSEFEAVTALGLYWFAQKKCDVVVLEVGLGGRLDATNVIAAPLCAVITHISYDHTEILGSTLTEIAGEKCGILKEGCDVVCAPGQDPEALAVIRRTAKERHCRLTEADASLLHVTAETLSGTAMQYRGQPLQMRLLGDYQVVNASSALACMEVLHQYHGFSGISAKGCADGLAAVRMPARFEIFSGSPLTVVDGAHNPDGAQALAACLRRYLPNRRLVALSGMCADKDTAQFVRTLAPLFFGAVMVPLQNPRGMRPRELASLWQRERVLTQMASSPCTGLELARQLAGPDGAVIMCGSLYLAGEVRPLLTGPLL